jgi:hypothetical protein
MTTLPLRTVLMREHRRQTRGNPTTRVGLRRMQITDGMMGLRRMRITDGMMGLRRRIKVDPMITRRHRRHRIGTVVKIGITTATGMANHITTCTQHQELL